MTKVFESVTIERIGSEGDPKATVWYVEYRGLHASGRTLFVCIEELRDRMLEAAQDRVDLDFEVK